MANLCQLTSQNPTNIETTSRGSALLAALGSGVFDSLMSARTHLKMDKQMIPCVDLDTIQKDYQG